MNPRRARASIRSAVAITCAALLAGAVPALASDASLTPSSSAVGVTPRYLGFNMGHFRPNSNTAAWTTYAAPNAYRVWASANDYEMADDNTIWGDGVSTFEQFEARKASLRVNPEDNNSATRHINWTTFNFRFENRTQSGRNHVVLNPMLDALHERGIEPIMQLTRTKEGYDFSGWEGKWEHWQFYYAMAYHTAKNYDVRRYMIYNEPDQNNSTATPSDYVERLKFASDAIRSAVADVNRIYGKDLAANVSGPTTKDGAAKFNEWGIPTLQANRTDYAGRPIAYDNLDTYDLHRYNSTGSAFANDINVLNTNVPLYNPSGAATPVTYTEFNRHASGTFADMAESLDTPSVFTSYAGNYLGAMSANVKGMYAFKFSQTWWDPGSGIEEPQKTGHYYVDNDDQFNADPFNVTGSTKGGEVARLITKGFMNQRQRLGGTVSATNSNFDSAFTFDPEKSNYYITTVNRNVSTTYLNTINLSAWNVAAGTVVSVEEVSANRHGQVVQYATVPANKTITLTQPGSSVWLLTVPSGTAQAASDILAAADAYVSGASPSTNFGGDVVANVSRNASTADDEVGYLKFQVNSDKARIGRAILWLDGQNVASSDAAILHVYGLLNDSWDESTINWTNAPNLSDTDAKIEGVGVDAFPIGSLQFDATRQAFGVDVTEYLRRHDDGVLSLAVAREQRFTGPAGADADLSRVALLTREAGAGAPRLSLFQTANAVHYWDVNASGNFSDGANWDVNSTPDGAGSGVVFGMIPTASRTVTLDAPRTLGSVSFNHPDAKYTLAGAATLTIDGGAGAAGTINTFSGTHTIAAPVELLTSVALNADAGAILSITQGLKTSPAAVGAASVTKSGGGVVSIKNGRNLAALNANGGTLEILPDGTAAGMSTVRALNVAGGAKLQMNDNDVIVDYTGASPEFALRDKVLTFRDGAGTEGIGFTETPEEDVILAFGEASELGITDFNGIAVDNTTIVGRYTYYGDANFDGQVTTDDYVAVDLGLGTGDSWVQGDFDLNGVVTTDDYVVVDLNLGKGTANPLAYAEEQAAMIALHSEMFGQSYLDKLAYAQENGWVAASIPEPASAMLLFGAPVLALRRRRLP